MARLETLVMMAGFELPIKAIRQQIAGAVDVIVQASRLQGGPRRVTHITEIVGMEQEYGRHAGHLSIQSRRH